MNFLEAHKIVHEFAGAIGRENKTLLIPYSWIKRDAQEITDAFVIFFGHMVLWHTRTNEECDQYMLLTHNIYNIISDDLYQLIVESIEILEKSKNPLFRLTHKDKIKNAEKMRNAEVELITNGHERYYERVQQTDFGELINEFQQYKVDYQQTPEDQREEFEYFIDDYIELVYSKTSYNQPQEEDYGCFFNFDYMRKLLNNLDSVASPAKELLEENRDYIMSSK